MEKTIQPLLLILHFFIFLLPSILFSFGIPVTLPFFFFVAGLNWNEFISSLLSCCSGCYGHKPSLSIAVSAVIETYYLCFPALLTQVASYFQGCRWITGIISRWHFFFLFYENLSALFTIFYRTPPPPTPREQIRAGWQTSETDPMDDVTQGHTRWRGGGGGLEQCWVWRAVVWQSRWKRVFFYEKGWRKAAGRKFHTGTCGALSAPWTCAFNKEQPLRKFHSCHLPVHLAPLPRSTSEEAQPAQVISNTVSLCVLCSRKMISEDPMPPPLLANECSEQQQFPRADNASCCSRLQLISRRCRETAHMMPSFWFPHCFLWFLSDAPQWQKWWRWWLWRLGTLAGRQRQQHSQFVSYWWTFEKRTLGNGMIKVNGKPQHCCRLLSKESCYWLS